MVKYFNKKQPKKKENVWLFGEGKNGKLHGRWIQNYRSGKPWIAGYFNHGQRSGQWKEYYQGTTKLCRTENWRNDKLTENASAGTVRAASSKKSCSRMALP